MRSALFAPVLIAMCAGAHAEDQAIIACENIVKSELLAPKSYESASRTAIGNMVSITFDAVNKYNAPIRQTQRCEFKQTSLGWVLAPSFSEDVMKSEFSTLVEKVKSGVLTKSDAESQVPEIERRHSALVMRDAARALIAQQAGPYPIPPNMTSLSQ